MYKRQEKSFEGDRSSGVAHARQRVVAGREQRLTERRGPGWQRGIVSQLDRPHRARAADSSKPSSRR